MVIDDELVAPCRGPPGDVWRCGAFKVAGCGVRLCHAIYGAAPQGLTREYWAPISVLWHDWKVERPPCTFKDCCVEKRSGRTWLSRFPILISLHPARFIENRNWKKEKKKDQTKYEYTKTFKTHDLFSRTTSNIQTVQNSTANIVFSFLPYEERSNTGTGLGD